MKKLLLSFIIIWTLIFGGSFTVYSQVTPTIKGNFLDIVTRSPWVDASSYGTNLTDTTIDAALTAIGSTNKTALVLRPGTWTISTNKDWATYRNVNFVPLPGALISHGSYTLNIPNPSPGVKLFQWLSGTGTVSFVGSIDYVYSEWWGAKADNSTESSAALNAAVMAGPTRGASGTYLITSSFVIPYGGVFRGSGKTQTKIKTTSAIKVIKSVSVDTPADTGHIQLSDFTIDGGNAATMGIEIGAKSSSYLNFRYHLHDLEVINCLNGMRINTSCQGSLDNIFISGTGTSSQYGLKFDHDNQGCLAKNIVVTGFVCNWYYKGTGLLAQNCYSYSEATDSHTVNLLKLENAYRNVLDNFLVEHLAGTSISEVLVIGDTGGLNWPAENIFRHCRWVGTSASAYRLEIGNSGGSNRTIYKTILEKCNFVHLAGVYDIKLTNSLNAVIDRCVHHSGYSSKQTTAPFISGNLETSQTALIPFLQDLYATAVPRAGTWVRGQIIWNASPSSGATPGWVCTQSGSFISWGTYTGNTDGSTGVITNVSTPFDADLLGGYISVSAGFLTRGPFKVLDYTSNTITVDANSNAAQTGVNLANMEPVFKAMANLQ